MSFLQIVTMSEESSSSGDERNVFIQPRVPGRGPTTMHRLARLRNNGERLTIVYNNQGQAVGDNANQMQSYIGVCVRQQIPITYENWKDVPKEMKDKIFDCIEVKSLLIYRSE